MIWTRVKIIRKDNGEEYLRGWWRHWVYKSPKFILSCPARTHGTVDKAFSGIVLLNEVSGSIPTKERITANINCNLTYVPGYSEQNWNCLLLWMILRVPFYIFGPRNMTRKKVEEFVGRNFERITNIRSVVRIFKVWDLIRFLRVNLLVHLLKVFFFLIFLLKSFYFIQNDSHIDFKRRRGNEILRDYSEESMASKRRDRKSSSFIDYFPAEEVKLFIVLDSDSLMFIFCF